MRRYLTTALLALSLTPAYAAPPEISIGTIGSPQVYLHDSKFTQAGSKADSPVRAFRDSGGLYNVFAIDSHNYPFRGANFDTVTQSTRQAFPSNFDPDPANFDYKAWVQTPYLLDAADSAVIAVIHNEFHGKNPEEYQSDCADNQVRANQTCWYVTGRLAISNNSGRTFRATGDLIGIPYRFATDMVRAGIGSYPIIRHPSSKYLFMMAGGISEYGAQQGGTCVARSIDNGLTWRFWTGAGFTGQFINPYVSSAAPEGHVCQPVIAQGEGSPNHVFYVRRHGVFVGLSFRARNDALGEPDRVLYRTTRNFIDWSDPAVLYEGPVNNSRMAYASMIDPLSVSPNLDYTDPLTGSPYLFFVRYPNGEDQTVRHVMRIKLDVPMP